VNLDNLRRDGYTIVSPLLEPAEVDRLEALTDRAVAFHNREIEAPANVYQSVSRKDGITFVNELADDSGLMPAIKQFAMQPRLADLFRSIAGGGAAHYCYQIVYKHPQFHDPFPWHQDHLHTPTDEPFFNLWIALSDMTVENGCLHVMPGVGLDRVLPYHTTPWGYACWPLDDPQQGVPIVLKRGSGLLLTSKTLHKSGGNFTDRPRKAMLIAFMDRERHVNGERLPLTEYAGV